MKRLQLISIAVFGLRKPMQRTMLDTRFPATTAMGEEDARRL